MTERGNSFEDKLMALKNNAKDMKQWQKVRILNSRAEEELGDHPTKKQLAEFKSKYDMAFTSLGAAIEVNPEATDGKMFKWKNPRVSGNK